MHFFFTKCNQRICCVYVLNNNKVCSATCKYVNLQVANLRVSCAFLKEVRSRHGQFPKYLITCSLVPHILLFFSDGIELWTAGNIELGSDKIHIESQSAKNRKTYLAALQMDVAVLLFYTCLYWCHYLISFYCRKPQKWEKRSRFSKTK